ncbi:MAG: hypothetical protein ACK5MJ_04590 [Alphaproteobacteria bacterium]
MYKYLGAASLAVLVSTSAYGAECQPLKFSDNSPEVQEFWNILMSVQDNHWKKTGLSSVCLSSDNEVKVMPKGDGYAFIFNGWQANYPFKDKKGVEQAFINIQSSAEFYAEVHLNGDDISGVIKSDTALYNVKVHDSLEAKDYMLPIEMDISSDYTYNRKLGLYTKVNHTINQLRVDFAALTPDIDQGMLQLVDMKKQKTSVVDESGNVDISEKTSTGSTSLTMNVKGTDISFSIGETVGDFSLKGMNKDILGSQGSLSQCTKIDVSLSGDIDIDQQFSCIIDKIKNLPWGSLSYGVTAKDFEFKLIDNIIPPFGFSSKNVGYLLEAREENGIISGENYILLDGNTYNIDSSLLEFSKISPKLLPKSLVSVFKLDNLKKSELTKEMASSDDILINNIDIASNTTIILPEDAAIKTNIAGRINDKTPVTLGNLIDGDMPEDFSNYNFDANITTVNQGKIIEAASPLIGESAGMIGLTLGFFGQKVEGAAQPTYKYDLKIEDGQPTVNGRQLPSFGR